MGKFLLSENDSPNQREITPRRKLKLQSFVCLMAPGIVMPFLSPFLGSLQLSPTEIGVCLSVSPLLSVFAPHVWGQFADRFHRPERFLIVCCAGSALGYLALSHSDSLASSLLALLGASLFQPAIQPLLDTLAVSSSEQPGENYPAIRAFGSLGFAMTTVTFGLVLSSRIELVPLAIAGCYGLSVVLGIALFRGQAASMAPRAALRFLNLPRMLKQQNVWLVLVVGLLHWMACTPYHGSLALHFESIGLARQWVGLAFGVGVFSEVLVLLLWNRWALAVSPRRVWLVVFGVSAVRWLAMSCVSNAVLVVALSLLHGLTFGAFAAATVAFLSAKVSAEARATGQAVWASAVFGLGGVFGFFACGPLFEAFGGRWLFAMAAGVELVAFGVVFFSDAFELRINAEQLSSAA